MNHPVRRAETAREHIQIGEIHGALQPKSQAILIGVVHGPVAMPHSCHQGALRRQAAAHIPPDEAVRSRHQNSLARNLHLSAPTSFPLIGRQLPAGDTRGTARRNGPLRDVSR